MICFFLSLKSHCLFFADSDEFGIFLSIYSAKFEMCSFGQFFFYAGMSISNIQQIIFSSLSLNIVCKNIINNILFNKVWLFHSNILHEPRQLIQRKLKYIFACFATFTV